MERGGSGSRRQPRRGVLELGDLNFGFRSSNESDLGGRPPPVAPRMAAHREEKRRPIEREGAFIVGQVAPPSALDDQDRHLIRESRSLPLI